MSLMQQCLDCISAIGASTAEWREILGVRHWLQAPVLPEPQGFSLPSSKGRDAGGDCLARCRPCGRRSGAQQRLPRSFLSPVPVLPTSANLVAEAVYALTTHRSYSYCVITPA